MTPPRDAILATDSGSRPACCCGCHQACICACSERRDPATVSTQHEFLHSGLGLDDFCEWCVQQSLEGLRLHNITPDPATGAAVERVAPGSVRAGIREGEVRFLSDDRDLERNELVIFAGGNGDWYVGVVAEHEAGTVSTSGRFVRIATSGVAVDGMPNHIAAIYRLLLAALRAARAGG